MSKRIAFTFDQQSFGTLESMTADGHYSSMADCVRESLQINRVLQLQAQRGFTEVIVRNPTKDAERVLVIPRLILLGAQS